MSDEEYRRRQRAFAATSSPQDARNLAVYEERRDGQAWLLHICFLRALALFNARKSPYYPGGATLQDIANILEQALQQPNQVIPFLFQAPGIEAYETAGIVAVDYIAPQLVVADGQDPQTRNQLHSIRLGLFIDFSNILVRAYPNEAHSYEANVRYLQQHEDYEGRRDTHTISPAQFYDASQDLEIKVSPAYVAQDDRHRERTECFVSIKNAGSDLRRYVAHQDSGSTGIASIHQEGPIRGHPGHLVVAFSQQYFPSNALIDWRELSLPYDIKRMILRMALPHRLQLNPEYVQRWLLLFRNQYFSD